MGRRWSLAIVLTVVCLSSTSTVLAAQASPPTETVSGRVVSSADGLPLPYSRIWIFEANGTKSYTPQQTANGDFSIVLPEGYYFVFIGDLGCVPYAKEIWLRAGSPMKLMVRLDLDL